MSTGLVAKRGAKSLQGVSERIEQMDLSRKTEPSYSKEQPADESPTSPGVVAVAAIIASLLLGLCCAAVILLR